uniref:Tyrosine-protein phosphatase domain-containing protein n=1 Tax=Caenorhabditis tropicalis TaxID=1561998 RepID=A0A1I7UNY1_9PELO
MKKKEKKKKKSSAEKAEQPEKVDVGKTDGTVGASAVIPTTPSTPMTPPAKPSSQKRSVSTPVQAGQWKQEAIGKSWLEKADFFKAKNDYDAIRSLGVNVEAECKKWSANQKLNRSEEYPSLDSNLLKLDEYVNINQIDGVLSRPILMAQYPIAEHEGPFWKTVFDKKAMRIYICNSPGEDLFFPQVAEEFKVYGGMWVNNRHVSGANAGVTHASIEVLPPECSNSIISGVRVINDWAPLKVPPKNSAVVREIVDMMEYLKNAAQDETVLIMSLNGSARSAFFLALSAAIQKLEDGIEPCIADIVKTICVQRPKAEGSFNQYIGLYTAVFYYIGKKSKELSVKCDELTKRFAAELEAEAAKQSQMVTFSTASAISMTVTTGQK